MAFGDKMKAAAGTGEQGNAGGFINPFLNLKGDRIMRIRGDEQSFWRYWLPSVNTQRAFKGRSVIVGRNNPIKERMDAIGKGNEGYLYPSKRFYVNVLDRTLVKKLKNGKTVYQERNQQGRMDWPKEVDGEQLAGITAEASNTIRILEGGTRLMDSFLALNGRAVNNVTGEPANIGDIDLLIISTGEGTSLQRNVMPHLDHKPLSDELLALPLYDLTAITRPVPNEAVQRILDGDDYEEVMASIGFGNNYPLVGAAATGVTEKLATPDSDDEIPF